MKVLFLIKNLSKIDGYYYRQIEQKNKTSIFVTYWKLEARFIEELSILENPSIMYEKITSNTRMGAHGM